MLRLAEKAISIPFCFTNTKNYLMTITITFEKSDASIHFLLKNISSNFLTDPPSFFFSDPFGALEL